jgi:hypothetical protein
MQALTPAALALRPLIVRRKRQDRRHASHLPRAVQHALPLNAGIAETPSGVLIEKENDPFRYLHGVPHSRMPKIMFF